MSSIFDSVETLVVPRSYHKLSPSLRTTMTFGKLYPTFVKVLTAGETVDIYQAQNIKAQPMNAPCFTPMTFYSHAFFVPFRILDDNFAQGFTGVTEEGEEFNYEFPKWSCPDSPMGKLWDYFGLPINVNENFQAINTNVKGVEPTAYLKRAYNKVFNEWFRNENLIDEVDLDSEVLQYRAWRKDYFTSALPFRQKPSTSDYFALPVNTVVDGHLPINGYGPQGWLTSHLAGIRVGAGASGSFDTLYASFTDFPKYDGVIGAGLNGGKAYDLGADSSFANAISTSFDVSDMRFAFQMQKWAERNARCGTRFTEFLRAHYGVSPRDERLQIPEFIGGTKAPIIISDVVQTSESTSESKQGNRSALGNSLGGDHVGKYHATEPGVVIIVSSILPQAEYSQGVNRMFMLHDRLDFVTPEFCCLSERAIDGGEICVSNSTDDSVAEAQNKRLFGFTGIYNEFRYLPNLTTGQMRTLFNYWHMSRTFDSSQSVNLNQSFVECHPDLRIFAVQTEDPFIVNMKIDVKDFLPITYRAEPGLIDHF